MRSKKQIATFIAALAGSTLLLSACNKGSDSPAPAASGASAPVVAVHHEGIKFPEDAVITQALQANFQADPDSAHAREMVKQLGGANGQLQYQIKDVVARDGGYQVHYDVSLKLAQDGQESLRQVLSSMIPEGQKPADTSLAGLQAWFNGQVSAIGAKQPDQARALQAMMQELQGCYAHAKAGQTVQLMQNLRAGLWPARSGWYTEKLPAPGVQVRCLPM